MRAQGGWVCGVHQPAGPHARAAGQAQAAPRAHASPLTKGQYGSPPPPPPHPTGHTLPVRRASEWGTALTRMGTQLAAINQQKHQTERTAVSAVGGRGGGPRRHLPPPPHGGALTRLARLRRRCSPPPRGAASARHSRRPPSSPPRAESSRTRWLPAPRAAECPQSQSRPPPARQPPQPEGWGWWTRGGRGGGLRVERLAWRRGGAGLCSTRNAHPSTRACVRACCHPRAPHTHTLPPRPPTHLHPLHDLLHASGVLTHSLLHLCLQSLDVPTQRARLALHQRSALAGAEAVCGGGGGGGRCGGGVRGVCACAVWCVGRLGPRLGEGGGGWRPGEGLAGGGRAGQPGRQAAASCASIQCNESVSPRGCNHSLLIKRVDVSPQRRLWPPRQRAAPLHPPPLLPPLRPRPLLLLLLLRGGGGVRVELRRGVGVLALLRAVRLGGWGGVGWVGGVGWASVGEGSEKLSELSTHHPPTHLPTHHGKQALQAGNSVVWRLWQHPHALG